MYSRVNLASARLGKRQHNMAGQSDRTELLAAILLAILLAVIVTTDATEGMYIVIVSNSIDFVRILLRVSRKQDFHLCTE